MSGALVMAQNSGKMGERDRSGDSHHRCKVGDDVMLGICFDAWKA